jgi:hypothetical protein
VLMTMAILSLAMGPSIWIDSYVLILRVNR